MDSTAAPPQPERPPGVADEGADAGVSSIDVIIELYKRDVDRTLLIEQLRKTPAQRADDLNRFYRACITHRRSMKMADPR